MNPGASRTSLDRILFEAEDETRYYRWQPARVELEPTAGTITILGQPHKKPTITLSISEIAGCEIVEREDISTFGRTLFGWLTSDETGDAGCLLTLLLWPIAVVDAIAAQKTEFPVVKLSQSTSADPEQGWMIHLRARKRGRRGRSETREMTQRIVTFLDQSGYGGSLPDLESGVWGID